MRRRRHFNVAFGLALAVTLSWSLVPNETSLQAIAPSKLESNSNSRNQKINDDRFSWTYGNARGPEDWSILEDEFAACGGRSQSPIDIPAKKRPQIFPIQISYEPSSYSFVDTGRTWALMPSGQQSVVVDGVDYRLKSVEFHSPSEHTITGFSYPLEIQLIHESLDGKQLGFAVFVDRDKNPSSGFESILAASRLPASTTLQMNLGSLLPKNHKAWSYNGSMTVPPCREGMKWFLFAETIEFSTEQIAEFRKSYPNNARPVQDRNGRTLDLLPASVVSH